MKRLLTIIVILFSLFLNTSIEYLLGFNKTIYVAILFMIFFIAINIFTQKMRFDKVAVYVILLAFIIIGFKLAIGQDYITRMLIFLITPMFISICFEYFTKKELTTLFRLIIIFFIAECGLSIIEWSLNRNFFVISDWHFEILSGFVDEGNFRSSSLLGHPLSNAQIVAVFMTFIAVSNFKRKYIQIFLFFLGYVSLFCFGARGATLVVTTFVIPYFIWKINKTTQPSKKWIIKLSVFCMLVGLIYGVTQTQLGGRLMNEKLMDDSAQTRLAVFQFYDFYQTNDDFLWGRPEYAEYLLDIFGFPVENSVVALILDFGIIFTIPILLLLFTFQYRKLSIYSKFEKWLLLSVFYMIGIMNPNLVLPVQWTMWINACSAFRSLQTENI